MSVREGHGSFREAVEVRRLNPGMIVERGNVVV